MKPKKQKKGFLQKPEYPNGKKALLDFIRSQLRYPEDALEEKIGGIVVVEYEVSDEGKVENASVIKKLHPSCDEEAIRIVKLLQYGKAFNHGIRVKTKYRINIHFQLPKKQKGSIQYNYIEKKPQKINEEKTDKPKQVYSYTIKPRK